MRYLFLFISSLFSVFSPTSCLFCLQGNESVCFICLSLLKKINTPLPLEGFALFSYKDEHCRQLLRRAKYSHHFLIYKQVIRFLVMQSTFPYKKEKAVIVPVPMHRLRKLIRGQNHAEHIARFLSEEIGTPYYRSALIKRNYTKRQALLSRSKRLLSQKNSFMVSEKFVPLLRDKNILLVDDIVTTGSTVGEAKKVLMEAGAKSVFVIALAH